MNTLHERLKKYRVRRGLTLAEAATLSGVPVSTYKEWENGRQIRGEPYVALAQTYQISLQELLTGEKSQLGPALEQLDQLEQQIQTLKKNLIALF